MKIWIMKIPLAINDHSGPSLHYLSLSLVPFSDEIMILVILKGLNLQGSHFHAILRKIKVLQLKEE